MQMEIRHFQLIVEILIIQLLVSLYLSLKLWRILVQK
nr:MAG TPA: hypothetical protein [Bacteriophage sp.]